MNYISYSLYGTDPKYCDGIEENIVAALMNYPDWKVVVYIEPKHRLINTIRFLGAVAVGVDEPKLANKQMFWRFLAMNRDDANAVIFRDADSRLGPREAAAVNEWLKSDKHFHVMRDHPHHLNLPVCGGMWGCRGVKMPELRLDIDNFDRTGYYADMIFLYYCLWPTIKQSVMIHGIGGQPFPIHGDDFNDYVGQVWNSRYTKDDSRPKNNLTSSIFVESVD